MPPKTKPKTPLATALYIATLNEADLIALRVAETTFDKNFRINETKGYLKWFSKARTTIMMFLYKYSKKKTQIMSKDASTVISCKMPNAMGSKLRSIVYSSGADNVIITNNDII